MPWSNQSGGGGPWGSGPRGPWSSGPQSPGGSKPPDLEEFLRRSQDRLRSLLPGNLGGRGIALIALAAVVLWGFSGFFRVEPDELGVVLRFGKFTREVQPGLNYHLPYPIETALTPPALRINKIDIGMRPVEDMRRGTYGARSARGKPDADRRREHRRRGFLGVLEGQAERGRRLSVQHPKSRRHRQSGGRSAMREVVGRSTLQPILTGARQTTETAVQDLMQKTLDHYGAGIHDAAGAAAESRSAGAGDRRLPRRAGGALDLERAQNEAQTYANRVVPEARGRAAKITQDAEAYREQTVAEATGQTSRFLQVYDQYKKAPDVTRERMYLETMERVLGGSDKTIIDTGPQPGPGVVPYLPLTELPRTRRKRPLRAAPASGGNP